MPGLQGCGDLLYPLCFHRGGRPPVPSLALKGVGSTQESFAGTFWAAGRQHLRGR